MKRLSHRATLLPVALGLLLAVNLPAQQQKEKVSDALLSDQGLACVDCHKDLHPKIVSDWKLSKHSQSDVNCQACHGGQHMSKDDVAKAEPALPAKCVTCHERQVKQFTGGKHALAWISLNAMPTVHWQPMAQIEGLKGCGGCHRHGLKSATELKKLRESGSDFGLASCDVCHTRHLFSVEEARSPQVCQTCHMGIDHPQWEMYSSSKHGIRYLLKQNKVLPEDAAAPTCQTCHMRNGNHEVRTAWGFLAVRLPMPEDPKWAADRATILQALGVLDPAGNPTARLEAVKAADIARLTQESWQAERDTMNKACSQCHSSSFVQGELEKGDQMIRESDRLMAEAIRVVAGLYQDGTLNKPESYAHPFPDLLTFHDAPTTIEQKLFVMFLEHRMRTFQGAFHNNPDYSLWYGWSAMQRDLTEIREQAELMRARFSEASATPGKPSSRKK
jgi:hydroxylamine dehydrogenase